MVDGTNITGIVFGMNSYVFEVTFIGSCSKRDVTLQYAITLLCLKPLTMVPVTLERSGGIVAETSTHREVHIGRIFVSI